MKNKKLMVVARSFAGRRRKMFELQRELFGEVRVYCKLGEKLPEVIYNYKDVEESVKDYKPDVIHVYIDSAETANDVLKTRFPCVLDMYDCCEMRGQRDDHLGRVYRNSPNCPKIFSSELQAEYIRQNYGLKEWLFIPNVAPAKWIPKIEREKIPGDNIVYFGGISNQTSKSFYYRYYYDLFEIFISQGIDVHIYPNQIAKDLEQYDKLGAVIHKTLPMVKLFEELNQYRVGFVGYFGIGAFDSIPVEYAKRCLPNKAFDYMFAGIPTLAYNLGYGERFVRNWGLCVDYPEQLIAGYEVARDMKIDYEQWQSKYCLERYREKLVGIYEKVLKIGTIRL